MCDSNELCLWHHHWPGEETAIGSDSIDVCVCVHVWMYSIYHWYAFALPLVVFTRTEWAASLLVSEAGRAECIGSVCVCALVLQRYCVNVISIVTELWIYFYLVEIWTWKIYCCTSCQKWWRRWWFPLGRRGGTTINGWSAKGRGYKFASFNKSMVNGWKNDTRFI